MQNFPVAKKVFAPYQDNIRCTINGRHVTSVSASVLRLSLRVFGNLDVCYQVVCLQLGTCLGVGFQVMSLPLGAYLGLICGVNCEVFLVINVVVFVGFFCWSTTFLNIFVNKYILWFEWVFRNESDRFFTLVQKNGLRIIDTWKGGHFDTFNCSILEKRHSFG